jgi:hypothetical protein
MTHALGREKGEEEMWCDDGEGKKKGFWIRSHPISIGV